MVLCPQIEQLVQVKINLIKRQQEANTYDQKFLKILYFGNLLFLDKEYKAILDLDVITHISSIYYSQILDTFVYKHVINYVKFVQRFHISLDHTVGNFRNFSLEKVKQIDTIQETHYLRLIDIMKKLLADRSDSKVYFETCYEIIGYLKLIYEQDNNEGIYKELFEFMKTLVQNIMKQSSQTLLFQKEKVVYQILGLFFIFEEKSEKTISYNR